MTQDKKDYYGINRHIYEKDLREIAMAGYEYSDTTSSMLLNRLNSSIYVATPEMIRVSLYDRNQCMVEIHHIPRDNYINITVDAKITFNHFKAIQRAIELRVITPEHSSPMNLNSGYGLYTKFLKDTVTNLKTNRHPYDKEDDKAYEYLDSIDNPLHALIVFLENTGSGQAGWGALSQSLASTVWDLFEAEANGLGETRQYYIELVTK